MSMHARYCDDRAVLILGQHLTKAVAIEFSLEVELAIGYYQYRHIEIRIDCPGGDVAALDSVLSDMRICRSRGVVVQTYATGIAASAAATLLILGDIGSRSARSQSRLLLHEPSVLLGSRDRAHTRSDVERILQSLNASTDRLVDMMTSHVWAGSSRGGSLKLQLPGNGPCEIEVDSAAELREVYSTLLRHETWLTPAEAVGLHFIDRVDPEPDAPAQDAHLNSPWRKA